MSAGIPYAAEVRGYLDDCAAHPGLDGRYHPTADGAVKIIWHSGKDAEDQIRAAFNALTEGPAASAAPGAATAGGHSARAAHQISFLGDDPDATAA